MPIDSVTSLIWFDISLGERCVDVVIKGLIGTGDDDAQYIHATDQEKRVQRLLSCQNIDTTAVTSFVTNEERQELSAE